MSCLAIIGSRNFNDYDMLKSELDNVIPRPDKIVSGGAKGADKLGALYAKEYGIPLLEYLPDWDKHGKSAGFVRNKEIVNNCDYLIAFWDGVSKGTKHSIDLAHKQDKVYKVVTFTPETYPVQNNAVMSFRGKYNFLSNFYNSPFYVYDILFPTVEHYFQAMKSADMSGLRKIAEMETPAMTKKAGKVVKLRKDWEQIKDQVMTYGIFKKFEIPELRQKLLETGDVQLIEGNNWGDTYWGMCLKTKQGKNKLGEILMQERQRIRTTIERYI